MKSNDEENKDDSSSSWVKYQRSHVLSESVGLRTNLYVFFPQVRNITNYIDINHHHHTDGNGDNNEKQPHQRRRRWPAAQPAVTMMIKGESLEPPRYFFCLVFCFFVLFFFAQLKFFFPNRTTTHMTTTTGLITQCGSSATSPYGHHHGPHFHSTRRWCGNSAMSLNKATVQLPRPSLYQTTTTTPSWYIWRVQHHHHPLSHCLTTTWQYNDNDRDYNRGTRTSNESSRYAVFILFQSTNIYDIIYIDVWPPHHLDAPTTLQDDVAAVPHHPTATTMDPTTSIWRDDMAVSPNEGAPPQPAHDNDTSSCFKCRRWQDEGVAKKELKSNEHHLWPFWYVFFFSIYSYSNYYADLIVLQVANTPLTWPPPPQSACMRDNNNNNGGEFFYLFSLYFTNYELMSSVQQQHIHRQTTTSPQQPMRMQHR